MNDWVARAAFLVVGVAVGAVTGILFLVAACAVFWFFCMAFSDSHGTNTGDLPKGSWKIVLAVVATLGFTAVCYYLGGWQGILIGGAIVGGPCGGLIGLAARSRQEKRRRLRETALAAAHPPCPSRAPTTTPVTSPNPTRYPSP